MKLNKMARTSIATLTLIGSLTGGVHASTVIIFEDFEAKEPYLLNGSTADTGQTWIAATSLSGGVSNTSINPTSYLSNSTRNQIAQITGITLNSDSVYKLSMDVNVMVNAGGDASDWFGFGFRTGTFSNLVSGTVGSILHRANPQVQTFTNNGSGAQTSAAGTGLQNLEITLTTGPTLSNSTLMWEVDGVQVGISQTVDASAIDGVFLHTFEDSRGSIDNFTLTNVTVPEPSSTLLLGLGSLGLAFRRSRR